MPCYLWPDFTSKYNTEKFCFSWIFVVCTFVFEDTDNPFMWYLESSHKSQASSNLRAHFQFLYPKYDVDLSQNIITCLAWPYPCNNYYYVQQESFINFGVITNTDKVVEVTSDI